MSLKFLRTDAKRYKKLGKNRRKKQVWRAARGRHSKIRKRRAGYPAMPLIGFKKSRVKAGLINGLKPILVNNEKELSLAGKGNIVILSSRLGARKRIDLLKKASDMQLQVFNGGWTK